MLFSVSLLSSVCVGGGGGVGIKSIHYTYYDILSNVTGCSHSKNGNVPMKV